MSLERELSESIEHVRKAFHSNGFRENRDTRYEILILPDEIAPGSGFTRVPILCAEFGSGDPGDSPMDLQIAATVF
jgi:hypothetical protein